MFAGSIPSVQLTPFFTPRERQQAGVELRAGLPIAEAPRSQRIIKQYEPREGVGFRCSLSNILLSGWVGYRWEADKWICFR
jgi:hypothetical protein